MNYSQYPRYELRRKVLSLLGAQISIAAEDGSAIGFIKMKAFKLREDVRLYRNESMQEELMAIHARSMIDFGATYDVTDTAAQSPLFSFRRKGLRSAFVRDTWEILDTGGTVIGGIQETSGNLAIVRRWLSALSDIFDLIFAFVKQTYEISLDVAGAKTIIATIERQKNPVVVKLSVDQSMAPAGTDARMAVAGSCLLAIVDAGKN